MSKRGLGDDEAPLVSARPSKTTKPDPSAEKLLANLEAIETFKKKWFIRKGGQAPASSSTSPIGDVLHDAEEQRALGIEVRAIDNVATRRRVY